MNQVERVWRKLHTVGVSLSLLFLALSLPFLVLALFVIEAEPNWGYVPVLTLLANGALWLLLGLFGFGYNKVLCNKLSRLKASEGPYEVVIERILPNWGVRLGGYITAAVEGHYTDGSGNIHTVRSTNHIFTTFEKRDDFTANVYVDQKNPKVYAVEILRRGQSV